jgi:hypothetical protein
MLLYSDFSYICVFAQIISDLLHFKGSHKHEFDSRWKRFNLVKKSMENRVSEFPSSHPDVCVQPQNNEACQFNDVPFFLLSFTAESNTSGPCS